MSLLLMISFILNWIFLLYHQLITFSRTGSQIWNSQTSAFLSQLCLYLFEICKVPPVQSSKCHPIFHFHFKKHTGSCFSPWVGKRFVHSSLRTSTGLWLYRIESGKHVNYWGISLTTVAGEYNSAIVSVAQPF